MDTTSLRSAYAALLDLARTGEFGTAGTPAEQLRSLTATAATER